MSLGGILSCEYRGGVLYCLGRRKIKGRYIGEKDKKVHGSWGGEKCLIGSVSSVGRLFVWLGSYVQGKETKWGG